MRYPLPELKDLSPAFLAALAQHPARYNTVEDRHGGTLPEAMQFQFDYAAAGPTPPAPLPVLITTLFFQEGTYSVNLGLVNTVPEYNTQHDDPVNSPLLARAVVTSLLAQVNVLLEVVPSHPELLRPVRTVAPVSADAPLEPAPEANAVSQNENPNTLLTPAAVLTGADVAARGHDVVSTDPYHDPRHHHAATVRQVLAADPQPTYTPQGDRVYPSSEMGTAVPARTVVVTDTERRVMDGPQEFAGSVAEGRPLVLVVDDGAGTGHTYDWTPVSLPSAEEAAEYVRRRGYAGTGTLTVYHQHDYRPGMAGSTDHGVAPLHRVPLHRLPEEL